MVSMYIKIFLNFWLIFDAYSFTQHCHPETGRCFWVSDTNTANWADARTACQLEGGDLAVMETVELYDYVINTFRYSLLNYHSGSTTVIIRRPPQPPSH